MAYMLAFTMWIICFYMAKYFVEFKGVWGTIQWIMLFFTVLFAVSSIFIYRMGSAMKKENKEKKKQEEAERRRRARMHYEMTYEGIDVIPDESIDESNIDDYNVYMNIGDGEVYYDEDGNEKLYIAETDNTQE